MFGTNETTRPRSTDALWRLVLVAVLFFGLLALANPVAAEGPASDTPTAKFEVRFMEDMIEHHMMAVHMGEMCLEKAVHPELKAMCEEVVATQMMEIEQVQGWLMEWYGIAYMPEMKMTGEMMRLMSLEGGAFEEVFMKTMIRHHWGGILESRQAVSRAGHEELRDLGTAIIAAQSQEMGQMQTWLREWYGYHNFGPGM